MADTLAERFQADLAAHPNDPVADAIDRALAAMDDRDYQPTDPRHLVTLVGNRIECVAYCSSTDKHISEYRAPDVQGG